MKSSLLKTIFMDCVTTVLCLGPILLALIVTWEAHVFIGNSYITIVLAPFIIVLSFTFIVFIFRLFLPRLQKGVFPIGFNLGFMGWLTHSMLTRSARISGIHYLIHAISLFRWLYWRALGAKVAYSMSTSYRITLHDIALIEIEEGVILAEDVEISGHLVRGDRVLVAPVKIGKGSFIGRGTYIGPRTRIGENCWIGMGNNIAGEVLAPNSKIASHEWARGNPKRSASQDNP